MPPFFQTVQQSTDRDPREQVVVEGITIRSLPDEDQTKPRQSGTDKLSAAESGAAGSAAFYSFEKEAEANGQMVGESRVKPARTGWRRYLGMIFTLSASLNFSFGVLFAKLLQSYGYHGNCASFWRYMGVVVPAVPMMFYYEYLFSQKNSNANNGGIISTAASTASIISANTEDLKKAAVIASADKGPPSRPSSLSVFNGVWPLCEDDNWKTAFGVFLRSFFAATAVILRFYALEYLPIGDTSVISYSTPVLVTILAHIFLGEKAGIVSFVIAFTTLVGVAIVAKPPMLTGAESFTTDTLIGTGLAVASLLCASTQIVLTRVIRSVHFSLLTVTVGVLGLGIAGALMLHFQDFVYPTQLTEGLYVAGLTATSYFGQMSIILALKFELAGPVSLIRCSDSVIGFVLQYIFLDVVPEWTSVVGGLIVVGGVLVTGARKYVEMLPDDARSKRRFRFLLV